jgi:mono/diheme cytochrome c family protein
VRLPRRRLSDALLVVAVPTALALASCGREEEPDLVNGKTLFVQKCGSCHVLGRANTQGVQGPNLDEAFKAARREGMTEKTVEGVVGRQIANVRRNSKMPANLVVGNDARDVAAYVGEAAAQPGEDQGPLAQAGKPKTSNKPIRASGGQLRIDADPTGALAFASTRAIAQAGQLTLLMGNKSSVQHNIAVKNGTDEKGPVVGQGGTSRLSTSLEKGKYVFYCSVPGHEAGGMKGELTVE